MHLQVPDDILKRAEANGSDVRLAIAIQLYADNRIDHDDACRLADITPSSFNRELLQRAICIQQYPRRRNAG
jgi:predicted HTH domain antitoxin